MALRTRAKLLFGWAASLGVSYYVGGVVGFNKGVSTELILSSGDAVPTAVALGLIRDGRVAKATDLLEATLDSHIANAVTGEASYCSAFNVPMRFVFPKAAAVHARNMSAVLQYRDRYPGPNASLNQALMPRLKDYASSAPRPGLSRRGGAGACWPL